MTKFLRSIVTVAALACLALAVPAQAQVGITTAPAKVLRYSFETSVASGGAINSPVIDASGIDQLTFIVDPGGATARALVVNCMAKDGVTVLFPFPSVTVGASTKVLVSMSAAIIQGTAPTNVTYWAVPPCAKIQATVAASGALTASMAVYGR
jgi:hypothetical protein